uniref:non-specific serine/threonine protein kinase n=1 Tax=Hucho hucho TaxID=62062 RepID=A0A4W5LDS7_9TELE
YRATHRGTGEIVALKVMDRGTLAHPTQRRNIRREIHLMSKLHHPNLVHLFGVYESTNTVDSCRPPSIVLPIMPQVEIAFELSKGGEVMRRVLEPHASIFALTVHRSMRCCRQFGVHRSTPVLGGRAQPRGGRHCPRPRSLA